MVRLVEVEVGCCVHWQLAWSLWCFGIALFALVHFGLSLCCWFCGLCRLFFGIAGGVFGSFLLVFLSWLVVLSGAPLGVFCGMLWWLGLCVWFAFFAFVVCHCCVLLVLFLFAPLPSGKFDRLLIYPKKKIL